MSPPLIGVGRTDVGRKRSFNEDAFAIDLPRGLLALADGMGGHAAGEVASRLAIEAVSEFIARTDQIDSIEWPWGFDPKLLLSGNRLRTAARLAHERILAAISEDQELRGMGTTLVAVLVQGRSLSVAHVGDSRVYVCRPGSLDQVTNDHSWVNEQVGLGILSREEATHHPYRNIITRALGSHEEIVADISEMEIHPGESILLCSDGLTNMLPDQEILSTLEQHPGDPHAAAGALVERANDAGGEDNITVIVAMPT